MTDEVRLQEMQRSLQLYQVIASVLLIVYSSIGGAVSGLPALVERLKKMTAVLLEGMHRTYVQSLFFPYSSSTHHTHTCNNECPNLKDLAFRLTETLISLRLLETSVLRSAVRSTSLWLKETSQLCRLNCRKL